MKHLYLPFGCDGKSEISITGPDFHYLTHVLRFRQGGSFNGIDSTGKRYSLSIKHIEKESVTLSIKKSEILTTDFPHILLFQAIPKGKVMDKIIRQATEAGISRITPVITRYTVVDVTSQKTKDNKLQRWRRIAKEAVQQSGGPYLPYVSAPIEIKDVSGLSGGLKLLFHNDSKENKSLHECLSKTPDEIDIFIGPEGGFSDSEYNLLKKQGFIPINLGKNILRVDTAALYALASVKIIMLEKEYWRKK